MPDITLAPPLYERVEQAATNQQAEVEELLALAVERYLWELDRKKIAEESEHFWQQKAVLQEQYPDQFVAIHDHRVVDHDPDVARLVPRLRARFGHTPIMISHVDAPQNLVRHGFQLERGP